MQLITSSCASCGAPLMISPVAKSVRCDHCDTELIVKRDKPKKRKSREKEPDDENSLHVYTEVLDAVATGAAAMAVGASALEAGVDAVSAGTSFFGFLADLFAYAKLILILVVLAVIFGLCVVPSYLVYLYFSVSS